MGQRRSRLSYCTNTQQQSHTHTATKYKKSTVVYKNILPFCVIYSSFETTTVNKTQRNSNKVTWRNTRRWQRRHIFNKPTSTKTHSDEVADPTRTSRYYSRYYGITLRSNEKEKKKKKKKKKRRDDEEEEEICFARESRRFISSGLEA